MSCSLFFKMPALDIVLDPFKGHAYDPLGPPLLSKTRRVLRWVGVIWDTTTQRYLPDIYLGGEPFSKDVRYVSLSSLSLNIWGEVRSLIASEVSWGPQQDFVTT